VTARLHFCPFVRLNVSTPSVVLGNPRRFEVRARDGEILPIELKAFELGAPPLTPAFGAVMVDLRERLRVEVERDAALDHMAKLALTDELTGLPNRRAFMEALRREHASVQRYEVPTSIAVMDIDHFKQVNDTYGHDAGDEVLRQVAHVLCEELRRDDLVGRLGGEEFGAILTHDSFGDACRVGDRLCSAVRGISLEIGGSRLSNISISVGIAALDAAVPPDGALKFADRAMYQAKRLGRDRVEIH
jgi:diguanylate cyclase (GGDEF)-like protein